MSVLKSLFRRKDTANTNRAAWLSLAVSVLVFGGAFTKAYLHTPAAPFATAFPSPQPAAKLNSAKAAANSLLPRSQFVSLIAGPHRHAASLVELQDGRLRAFWFSGSKEGASDVVIASAVYDPQSEQWGPESVVTDRESTQSDLHRYVKKLGNPVAARGADGSLHLFYVTVSLGGWAGSSITHRTSYDEGQTWGPAQRLVTSPFINISTLVKGTPLHYADGTIGLPVYHEFIGKFAELLRLDQAGHLLDKQRLSQGRQALQPVLLVRSQNDAHVLMRHGDGGPNRVIETSTTDAGQHWAQPLASSLPNPSAAVSGVALADGRLLVVLNDIEDNRDALSLIVSTDNGQNWRTLSVLEARDKQTNAAAQPLLDYSASTRRKALATDQRINDPAPFSESAARHMCRSEGCSNEYSYPYLIQTRDGDLHLVYTWNRSFIKHVVFPAAWLAQQKDHDAIAH